VDPTSYAAWLFADSDIVLVDDATLARFAESDPWPATPELFAAGDGAVYLRDVRNAVPARRHVPSPDAMASWRLDWGAIASVDPAARDALAADVDISTRPYLVRGSGPAVYVIDAPPPTIVSAQDASTGVEDGGVSLAGDGGAIRARPDASGMLGTMRSNASGCSVSHTPGGAMFWALAFFALALARRR
jgi:MYXO-CTERM domain-containing protein